MKGILLTAALLFVSHVANAVQLSQSGKGEVLIFPFFTTENGWDSLLNISVPVQFDGNASMLGDKIKLSEKTILRVRVREAADGSVVNAFTIYNQHTVNWRGALTRNDTGETVLRVGEGDCLIAGDSAFSGTGIDLPIGTGSGIIEVFLIGKLTGPAISCDEIKARWETGGKWDVDPTEDVIESSQLSGELLLVNVRQGLAASYRATALQDFSDTQLHVKPTIDFPTLADADAVAILGNGDEIIPASGEGIDAVAHVLALGEQSLISNEVVIINDLNARTDWVISYPLAGYKRFRPFETEINGSKRFCEALGSPANGVPIVKIPTDEALYHITNEGQGILQTGSTEYLDPIPPTLSAGFDFCFALNIVNFNKANSILGLEGAANVSDYFSYLQTRISSLTLKFPSPVYPLADDIRRPVLGFRLTTFVNGMLEGGSVLANYAILTPHIRQ